MEDRGTRWPTEAEIAEISARHFVATPIKPADLLFVFGTREDVAQRADEAFKRARAQVKTEIRGGVLQNVFELACVQPLRERELGQIFQLHQAFFQAHRRP